MCWCAVKKLLTQLTHSCAACGLWNCFDGCGRSPATTGCHCDSILKQTQHSSNIVISFHFPHVSRHWWSIDNRWLLNDATVSQTCSAVVSYVNLASPPHLWCNVFTLVHYKLFTVHYITLTICLFDRNIEDKTFNYHLPILPSLWMLEERTRARRLCSVSNHGIK